MAGIRPGRADQRVDVDDAARACAGAGAGRRAGQGPRGRSRMPSISSLARASRRRVRAEQRLGPGAELGRHRLGRELREALGHGALRVAPALPERLLGRGEVGLELVERGAPVERFGRARGHDAAPAGTRPAASRHASRSGTSIAWHASDAAPRPCCTFASTSSVLHVAVHGGEARAARPLLHVERRRAARARSPARASSAVCVAYTSVVGDGRTAPARGRAGCGRTARRSADPATSCAPSRSRTCSARLRRLPSCVGSRSLGVERRRAAASAFVSWSPVPLSLLMTVSMFANCFCSRSWYDAICSSMSAMSLLNDLIWSVRLFCASVM